MDIQECMWKSALFFVASSSDHFTGIIVFVNKQATVDVTSVSNTFQDNFSSFGLIVLLLVLLGIEQGLTYVHNQQLKEVPKIEVCIEEEKESVVEEIHVCEEQIEYLSPNVGKYFLSLLDELRAGIKNNSPQRAEDGTSGVYFMKNTSDRRHAVFKPADEEGIHLEGYSGGEIKPGCFPGEGYLKEVAAYLLDKDGFHGVPPTTLATCSHDVFNGGVPVRKVGSLQEFVSSECTAEDMGSSRFTTRDVHKIGLLDCRILNLDRHLGNILVTEGDDGAYRLVPIDHALSLPAFPSGGASFEWLQFPQCKQPFDEETVNFVSNIDVESDVQVLRQQLPNLREECIETMKICTLFLKKAVASGLNLYEIGCMMSRYRDDAERSELENMCLRVKDRIAQHGADNISFWRLVDEEIDRAVTTRK